MIAFSMILGAIIGFFFAAKFVFGPLQTDIFKKGILTFFIGAMLCVVAFPLLFIGGWLMMFRSPLCGLPFAAMTFLWISGGNLLFKSVGFYKKPFR